MGKKGILFYREEPTVLICSSSCLDVITALVDSAFAIIKAVSSFPFFVRISLL